MWELTLPQISVVKADFESLERHWPEVRRRLLMLKKKIKKRAPKTPLRWEPEHFRFEALKNLQGGFTASGIEIFLALDNAGVMKGFFITALQYDSALHIPLDLLIWEASAWEPYVLEAALMQADDLARARGCTAIKHMSPFIQWGERQRKMMDRLRAKYGSAAGQDWEIEHITWRRSLVDE